MSGNRAPASARKSRKGRGVHRARADPKTKLAAPMDPQDKAAGKLVHQLNALRNDKKRTRDATKAEHKKQRAKHLAKVDASRAASSKAKAKVEYRKFGKDQAKKRAKFEAS